MMRYDQVEGDVREIVTQIMGVEPSQVGPGFDNRTVGAWTSLNHLMLISQLEAHFGVVFSNAEIGQLTSFTSIVTALEERSRASA